MSKIWLLLLLVAAVQFAHAYPAEYDLDEDYISDEVDDYLSDEQKQSTWGILKDAWGKLKSNLADRIAAGKKKSNVVMKKMLTRFSEKFCKEQADFEEDFDEFESDEEKPDKGSETNKIVQAIKDFYKKMNEKLGEKKEKYQEAIKTFRKKLCDRIAKVTQENDFDEDDGDDGDEERFRLGFITKIAKTIIKATTKAGKGMVKAGKTVAKNIKKLKGPLKTAMKKGSSLLKNLGFKIEPIKCVENSCSSCIKMKIPVENSACFQMKFMRTNSEDYLVMSFNVNNVPKTEKKIKIGTIPSCAWLGDLIGNVCLKGVGAKAKSSKGQGQADFCLGILAEKFNVGCKICASYANKKLNVRFEPKTFAGGKDENGEIVQLDQNGEDGLELGADEFETD